MELKVRADVDAFERVAGPRNPLHGVESVAQGRAPGDLRASENPLHGVESGPSGNR